MRNFFLLGPAQKIIARWVGKTAPPHRVYPTPAPSTLSISWVLYVPQTTQDKHNSCCLVSYTTAHCRHRSKVEPKMRITCRMHVYVCMQTTQQPKREHESRAKVLLLQGWGLAVLSMYAWGLHVRTVTAVAQLVQAENYSHPTYYKPHCLRGRVRKSILLPR